MQFTVVQEPFDNIISENKLCDAHKIFATKNGVLQGMIVKISEEYVLMISCDHVAYKQYRTIGACIEHGRAIGYSFYVEDGE